MPSHQPWLYDNSKYCANVYYCRVYARVGAFTTSTTAQRISSYVRRPPEVDSRVCNVCICYLMSHYQLQSDIRPSPGTRAPGLARPGPFSDLRRDCLRPDSRLTTGLATGTPSAPLDTYPCSVHRHHVGVARSPVGTRALARCLLLHQYGFYLGIFVAKKSLFRFSSSRGRRFLEDFRRNLQNELLSGPIFSWTAGLRRRPLKLARHAHRCRMASHQRPRPDVRFGGVCTPAADAAVQNA